MASNKLLRADSHAKKCMTKLTWTDTIIEQSESVSGSSSSAVRYIYLNMGLSEGMNR